jgi:hypothetical protein
MLKRARVSGHGDAHELGLDAGLEIVLDGIALRIAPKRQR